MLERTLTRTLALTLFAVVVGCGPAVKPTPTGLVPFTGSVTLDDKPMDGATIMLVPVSASSGQALDTGGVTDAGGKFELKAGEGKASGAMPGEYRVIITRLTKPDGSVVPPSPEKSPMQLMTEENAKESIPPQYSDMLGSKLTVVVPSGGGTHDFKLTSKK